MMNPRFVEAFTTKFVNKMSRVILCCQDGGARTEIAAGLLTEAGFTSIAVVEGGMDAYLAVSPLTDKARVRPEPGLLQRPSQQCALLTRACAGQEGPHRESGAARLGRQVQLRKRAARGD